MSSVLDNNKGIRQFTDLREGIRYAEQRKMFYYDLPVPAVPEKFNREYKKGAYKFNPFLKLCTCPDFVKRNDDHRHDFAYHRICTHLFDFYADKKLLPDHDRVLLWSEVKFGYHNIIRMQGPAEGDQSPLFLQMTPLQKAEWINAVVTAPGGMHYVKYSYSLSENRWSYGIPPEESSRIERMIMAALREVMVK